MNEMPYTDFTTNINNPQALVVSEKFNEIWKY